MNEIIQNMIHRRSIRKYKEEQITEEQLALILEAGQYAPSAGGRQSPVFVVCQDRETVDTVGKLNMECLRAIAGVRPGNADGKQSNLPQETLEAASAFYNAPTLVTLFVPKGWPNFTLDCAVAAENMLLAAASLGVGSCMIARAAETFATDAGRKIQLDWGLGDEMEAKVHVLLGYPADEIPTPKPRREGRVIRV